MCPSCNKKKSLKSVLIIFNDDRNVLVMEETPTLVQTLKRGLYISNYLPCCFLNCVLVCFIILLTLSLSAFQRSHFSDIHAFLLFLDD